MKTSAENYEDFKKLPHLTENYEFAETKKGVNLMPKDASNFYASLSEALDLEYSIVMDDELMESYYGLRFKGWSHFNGNVYKICFKKMF